MGSGMRVHVALTGDFRRRQLLAGLAGLTVVAGGGAARAKPAGALEPLEIITSKGRVRFQVEIAATHAQQQRGLMFRTALAPDRGMLFTYAKPQSAAFWMKNTLIPLDIIYIAPSGRVLSIARNARPHDETPIFLRRHHSGRAGNRRRPRGAAWDPARRPRPAQDFPERLIPRRFPFAPGDEPL